MEPRARTFLKLLDHESMSIWRLTDLTGVPPGTVEETLLYLHRFGIVEERQGYWIRPENLSNDRATPDEAIG